MGTGASQVVAVLPALDIAASRGQDREAGREPKADQHPALAGR